MSAVNKYRTVTYVKEQITKHGSVENYLNNISSGTARNYKTKIIEVLSEYKNKDKFIKILDKKIDSSFDKDSIENNLQLIINKIEENTNNDYVVIEEDFNFLLFLLCSSLLNKEIEELKKEDISFKIFENNIEISLNNNSNSKYLIIENIDLYKKLINTFNKKDGNKVFNDIENNYFINIIRNKFNLLGINYIGGVSKIKKIAKKKIIKKTI